MTKASCPGCGKVVAVAGPSSATAGRLPRHRSASGGGMCPLGGKHRALKRELIHPCARCAELPGLPELPGGYEAVEHMPADGQPERYRPPVPRPVTGTRPPLCATHRRAHTATLKERTADAQRTRRFGVSVQDWTDLREAQGGACACGVDHRSARVRLAAEHDHDRQRKCIAAGRHGPKTACKRCMRGAAGSQCNQIVLARFTPAQLRNLANYLEHPPAEQLGWWDDDEQEN